MWRKKKKMLRISNWNPLSVFIHFPCRSYHHFPPRLRSNYPVAPQCIIWYFNCLRSGHIPRKPPLRFCFLSKISTQKLQVMSSCRDVSLCKKKKNHRMIKQTPLCLEMLDKLNPPLVVFFLRRWVTRTSWNWFTALWGGWPSSVRSSLCGETPTFAAWGTIIASPPCSATRRKAICSPWR